MPKAKSLSSLFRSAVKSTTESTAKKTSAAGDKSLKQFVSSLGTSSARTSHSISKRLIELSIPSTAAQKPSPPLPLTAGDSILSIFKPEDSSSDSEDTKQLSREISAILCDGASGISSDSKETNSKKSLGNVLDIPWFSNLSQTNTSQRRKEVSRERKEKWIFKSTQVGRFDRLVRMCANKLGTKATIELFGKLQRETGVKEYNALIKICLDKARISDNEDVALENISRAFQLLKSMKEQGFQLEEESYGPFLMYLIDIGMVEEFHFFCKIIEEGHLSSPARLGYYEMHLYISVNNEEKIQELCNFIATNDGVETINLRENYLLALCESNRKNELEELSKIIDITEVSSLDHVVCIFKSLGRLLLETIAQKFLLAFKKCDYGAENISTLILNYATSIPNLAVEDVILKFKNLHTVLEMIPFSRSREKLIVYCCNLLQVHVALDMAEQMCEAGLTLSIETLHSILHASEESFEYNLVWRIYSLVCLHDLKRNNETFRSMISLSVKMKDFEGAYDMLNDAKKLNLTPTASLYNAIMAGYFREKNVTGALNVLKQMEHADVKPDSHTYSYLIGNCDSEEKIIKYYEEMKYAGIEVSKQIFMSLINAYADCGQFEKAKKVLSDKEIPVKHLSEVKSVLVSALASHGQMSDAFDIYEEIKDAGSNLEPKAVIALIEYQQSEGDLSRLLKLVEELHDPGYWMDGCCRVISYCVRNKHLSFAVNLLKQLVDRLYNDELAMEVIFDEVFSVIPEIEPVDLQMGFDLLQSIKDELGASPSRKCLDFLLTACVKAKDLDHSLLVWKEYQAAGLPYNVISYLSMYQALLASGDRKQAEIMLTKIPKDDPHVCLAVQACQKTYMGSPHVGSSSVKAKKEKKNKNKKKKQNWIL